MRLTEEHCASIWRLKTIMRRLQQCRLDPTAAEPLPHAQTHYPPSPHAVPTTWGVLSQLPPAKRPP